jgi:hypothetical protein
LRQKKINNKMINILEKNDFLGWCYENFNLCPSF